MGSNPLFVHAQGRVHKTKEWHDIVKEKHLINKKPSDKISFLTFIKGDIDFCLPKQLEQSNITYLNAVNNDSDEVWVNKNKIKYISESIQKIKTEYVVCLDAIDVLCSEDLSDLIDRFKKFDADILYNASRINYPAFLKLENKAWVQIEKEYYIDDTTSPYRFLNAGAFIGKTKSVKRFYDYLLNEIDKGYYKSNDKSEQFRVRFGRKNYDQKEKIKIDTDCIIFQTLNLSEFYYKDELLIVKE